MATLIAVYNSEGCVGRCDARCYNAKHENCNCICGGANHGKGLAKAIDNTREMVDQWLDDYRDKGFEFDSVRKDKRTESLPLPGFEGVLQ